MANPQVIELSDWLVTLIPCCVQMYPEEDYSTNS